MYWSWKSRFGGRLFCSTENIVFYRPEVTPHKQLRSRRNRQRGLEWNIITVGWRGGKYLVAIRYANCILILYVCCCRLRPSTAVTKASKQHNRYMMPSGDAVYVEGTRYKTLCSKAMQGAVKSYAALPRQDLTIVQGSSPASAPSMNCDVFDVFVFIWKMKYSEAKSISTCLHVKVNIHFHCNWKLQRIMSKLDVSFSSFRFVNTRRMGHVIVFQNNFS